MCEWCNIQADPERIECVKSLTRPHSFHRSVNSPGVAADISHINTPSVVTGYLPKDDGLQKALQGSDIVVIPAGVPRKVSFSFVLSWPASGRCLCAFCRQSRDEWAPPRVAPAPTKDVTRPREGMHTPCTHARVTRLAVPAQALTTFFPALVSLTAWNDPR